MAFTAEEDVSHVPTRDGVIAVLPEDRVAARAAVEPVVAVLAPERIIACTAHDGVIARAAQERIVAALAVQGVVARTAVQGVSAARAAKNRHCPTPPVCTPAVPPARGLDNGEFAKTSGTVLCAPPSSS